MKKIGFVSCIFFSYLYVLCIPSFSATIDDIVGTWDAYSDAKLKISGIGSLSDQNFSETILDLLIHSFSPKQALLGLITIQVILILSVERNST
jgi:hypothetical protein